MNVFEERQALSHKYGIMDYSTAMIAYERVVDQLTGEVKSVLVPLMNYYHNREKMQIFVKAPKGYTLTLEVSSWDTI